MLLSRYSYLLLSCSFRLVIYFANTTERGIACIYMTSERQLFLKFLHNISCVEWRPIKMRNRSRMPYRMIKKFKVHCCLFLGRTLIEILTLRVISFVLFCFFHLINRDVLIDLFAAYLNDKTVTRRFMKRWSYDVTRDIICTGRLRPIPYCGTLNLHSNHIVNVWE